MRMGERWLSPLVGVVGTSVKGINKPDGSALMVVAANSAITRINNTFFIISAFYLAGQRYGRF